MKGAATVSERSSYQPGVPCWVDLITTDVAAANRFYAEVFGWEIEDQGEEYGHYSLARLRGMRVAGVSPMPPGQTMPSAWSTYLTTSNLDTTAAKVKDAGGDIVMAPMDVGSVGRMAMVQDPAGAFVAFWQAGDTIGAELVNEPGALCWNELHVRDAQAADQFYTTSGGFELEQVEGELDYAMMKIDGTGVAGRLRMEGEAAAQTPAHWLCYFAVEDTDGSLNQIRSSGGSVMYGPEDTPFGRMAQCTDPTGAMVAIIQLSEMA